MRVDGGGLHNLQLFRCHSIFDQGIAYRQPKDQRTLFAFRVFLRNFYTLFFMAPGPDYIHPTFGGQSILTTSPGCLPALKAS